MLAPINAHLTIAMFACRARLRIDIRDFRLSQSPLITPSKIFNGDNEQPQFPAGCAVGGTICDASRGRCVAMSKHLCGVATDLALRCLRNAAMDTYVPLSRISAEQCAPCAAPAHLSKQAEGVKEHECTVTPTAAPRATDRGSAVRVEGVAIALCCHHCMIWRVSPCSSLRSRCSLMFLSLVLMKSGCYHNRTT